MFGGMDMNAKRKFLVVAVMLAVASGFFLDQFWNSTVCGPERVIAGSIVQTLVFSKFLAGIAGIHFLL